MNPSARPSLLVVAAAVAMSAAWHSPALAASKKAASKKAAQHAPAKTETPPPEAGAEQVEAAGQVYYGSYDCEFKQSLDIEASPKYPSYVDVKHAKASYLMKPVLSSTGAVRLEDVRGEALLVQIASKSMLLNVKTARRIVDDCVSAKQREQLEAAKLAALAGGTGAASSASLLGSAGPSSAAATASSPSPATAASAAPDAAAAPPASAASAEAAPTAAR